MKLNLGCGKDIKEGYLNIDINIEHPDVKKADIKNLDFIENKSVDEIYLRDVLEHFVFDDGKIVLKECGRVLKRGGKIYIRTTHIDKQIEAYTKGIWSLQEFNFMVFAGMNWSGNPDTDEDLHKCGYNYELLKSILDELNIKITSVECDSLEDLLKGRNLNITIEGVKK